jgi:hypothetical protein
MSENYCFCYRFRCKDKNFGAKCIVLIMVFARKIKSTKRNVLNFRYFSLEIKNILGKKSFFASGILGFSNDKSSKIHQRFIHLTARTTV